MDQEEDEPALLLDSPETITRRIEGHIVRGALDEERRARKALKLLLERDRKIASLERRIAEYERKAAGDYVPRVISRENSSSGDTSFESIGRDTAYLSLPPTEASNSQRRRSEPRIAENGKIIDEQKERFRVLSIPRLKLPTTSVSNSDTNAVVLKGVNSDFDNSSLTSEEFRHEESSVDLVVTAALAFSKFTGDRSYADDRSRVNGDGPVNNEDEKKKVDVGGSNENFSSTRMSSSLTSIKTRRRNSRRHSKRGMERKIGKSRGNNVLSRNLEEVQAGLDALLSKNLRRQKKALMVKEKQEVEDKVVQEDEQEAASTQHHIPSFERKIASTQTCTDFNEIFCDPTIVPSKKMTVISSEYNFCKKGEAKVWGESDEPAPQWLIEEALNRGQKFCKNDRSEKKDDGRDEAEAIIISPELSHENIISDLEKQLCATRVELAEALAEQTIIKNKYKKALKNAKIASDEERDELQRKLVQICTSVLDKFGPNAHNDGRRKKIPKKHHKPLQHFGKLSRKLRSKLKIATLTSIKLKRETLSARKDLDEKTRQYDAMAKCFADLKTELKNTESNLNDLLNENVTLRKKIDEAREWMQTRVSKERNEKINAAQFRDIQRSRELTNLRKKSEEDFATIAQLRGKLIRSESANSNKGFLLNSYKSQLADLTKEKEKLSSRIKELENENISLRNGNAQLRANLTLINSEKEKLTTESEKSEIDMKERMETKLATKYERSMLEKIDTMKDKYDNVVEAIENKLKASENLAAQYFGAIKHFLKEIHEYHRELDAERNLSCSEASEREAHETACTILNITPGELTGFLRGRSSNTVNSWLSDVQKITAKKSFVKDLGNFLFARAIGSVKN